ncbi:unnamed protein product [Heterobilharzia americana]|nr:unnamed protein product [Heterobilharzia americana]
MKPISNENQLCYNRPASKCEIISMDSKRIKCKTGSLVKTHYVTDCGVSQERGVGYEWEPKTLTIIQGDSVAWIWNTTTRTNPLMVAELTGPEDLTPSVFGFHSGEPKLNGVYRYNFTEPGTYYYASSEDFVMMGIVEVIPFDDCVTEVVVQTDYSTAIHKNVPEITVSWDPLTTCSGGISCSSLVRPKELSGIHGFVYRGCATPRVSSFTPSNIYAESEVEIISSILADCAHQVTITLGGAYCISPFHDVSVAGSLKCTLTEEQAVLANLITGQPLRPSIFHKDVGMALLTVSRNEFEQYAFFWPRVNCIKTKGVGSILGGGQFIVYGSGFDPTNIDLNSVTFNSGQKCSVIEVTSGYLKCLVPTPSNTTITSSYNVTVQVQTKPKGQDQWVNFEPSSAGDCIYSYALAATPIVQTIEPREVNINQTLKIGGSNLFLPGEISSSIQVYVGKIPCIVDPLSSSTDLLLCQITGSLPAGYVNLKLFHEIRGNAMYKTSLTLKSQTSIFSIDPNEGSFAGGTVVRITGNGLDDPSIRIYFGSEACQIKSENRSTYQVAVNTTSGSSFPDGFTYTNTKTPTISSVTTDSTTINGTLVNQLNIYGSKLLGDSSKNKTTEVKYNEMICVLMNIDEYYIQCYLPNLPSGQYQLHVDTPGYGYALSDFTTTVNFSLNSVNPSSGQFKDFTGVKALISSVMNQIPQRKQYILYEKESSFVI